MIEKSGEESVGRPWLECDSACKRRWETIKRYWKEQPEGNPGSGSRV